MTFGGGTNHHGTPEGLQMHDDTLQGSKEEFRESLDSIVGVAAGYLEQADRIGIFVCDGNARVSVIPRTGASGRLLGRLNIDHGFEFRTATGVPNPVTRAIETGSEQAGDFAPGGRGASPLILIAVPVRSGRDSGCAVVAGLADPTTDQAKLRLVLGLAAEALGMHNAFAASRDKLAQIVSEQQAIIENISDGLIVLDRSHVVRYMNVPAGRILSVIPRDAIGKRLEDLLEYEPSIVRIFETGVGFVDRETIRSTATRKVHLIDTAVPIKDQYGVVQSVVNTFREIRSMHRIAHKIAGNHARYTFDDLVGEAPSFQACVKLAKQTATGNATVLLSGESGTGKEVFAQAIHNESRRNGGPFVALNCAALPRELIESELFGYAPGSFTGAVKNGRPGKFELASGGTIFLDEISELPFDVQAKLLRVLQERQVVRVGDSRPIDVDVRVISASNRNLLEMVDENRFREDLYYRIHVIEIELPALRERREDIPQLATTFLRKCASALGKNVFRIESEAMRQLVDFDWPGNVRQLENNIERAVHLATGDKIQRFDLEAIRTPHAVPQSVEQNGVLSLAQAEKKALVTALDTFNYNITRTSAVLGVTRPTLYAKIRKHNLVLERGLAAGRDSVPNHYTCE